MKKKTFGRRHIQSGSAHSESPAAQIDPATRDRIIADLAEQARNGGTREQAELKRQTAEWREERYRRYGSDYGGGGFGDFGGGGDCGGGGD